MKIKKQKWITCKNLLEKIADNKVCLSISIWIQMVIYNNIDIRKKM